MKKLLLFLALIPLVYLVYGCSCNCSKNDMPPLAENQIEVPQVVLKNCEHFITMRTGNEYFDSYIKLDYANLKYSSGLFEIVYQLIVPNKPFVVAAIKIVADSTGTIQTPNSIQGIPDLATDTTIGFFNIDKAAAEKIAKENGLKEGIKPWRSVFEWNEEHKRYVWNIIAVFSESQGSNGYRGNGQQAILNTFDGKIISLKDWNVR